jgi:hypothetical protein
MKQLNSGITPDEITFDKRMEVVRNRSVTWLVNWYGAINNPEIVQKVIFLMWLCNQYILTHSIF